MKRGSQPSMNSFCCSSVAALAKRDGTTRELFIPGSFSSLLEILECLLAGLPSPISPLAPFSLARSFSSMREFSRSLVHLLSGDLGSRTCDKIRWGLRACLPSCTAVVLENCIPPTPDPSPFRRAPCCSSVPLAPPADTN